MPSQSLVPPRVDAPPANMRQWMAFVERALVNTGKSYTPKTATASGDVSPGSVGLGSFAQGALDNYVITSPYIQSGEDELSGRYVIDPDGIHFTDPWARLTIDLNAAMGIGYMTGTLTTTTEDVFPRASIQPTVYEYTFPDSVNVADTDHITWTNHGINFNVRDGDSLPAFFGVQTKTTFETDPDGNVVTTVGDNSYVLIRSARRTDTGKSTEVVIEDDSITFTVYSTSRLFTGSGSAAPTAPVVAASLRISATGVAITGNLTATGTITGA